MFDEFVKEIKKKKNLRNLDDAFVRKIVEKYLNSNQKIKKKLFSHERPLKSREFKVMLKAVREKLHEVYGVFEVDKNDLTGFVDSDVWHRKMLEKHRSTRERVDDYEFVYDEIFSKVKNVKSVLDLGCGLNPLSYRFISEKLKFFCCDVCDVDFLNEYFKKSGINGKAFVCDLTEFDDLPKADVCFMFKLLDGLESLEKGITKKLFKKLRCKYVVVSFSTKSIGGRKKIPERKWFLSFLKKYSYEKFETLNEVFYVIRM